MRRALLPFLVGLCLAVTASAQPADEAPPTPPVDAAPAEPKGLVVHDLLVLLCDNFGETYNAADLFENTLPRFARLSRRPRADLAQRHRPMPLGVLSFTGEAPESLDVLIEATEANPLYAWPPATTVKDTRVLWARLALNHDPDNLPELDDEAHWLANLRSADTLIAHANRKAAHALLYDVEVAGKNPLKIDRDGEVYTAAVDGDAPVQDAFLFKPTTDGQVRAVHITYAEGGEPAGTTAADATHADRAAALKTLRAALVGDGMPGHLADHAAATVGRFIEDEEGQMVAIARMRPAFLDQRLKLDLTPAAASVSRTALIIIVNADPDLVGQIDGLIAQLGDPSWPKRVKAQESLADLGAIAKPRLEANRNHADPEVAFRVEALLELLNAGEMDKDM